MNARGPSRHVMIAGNLEQDLDTLETRIEGRRVCMTRQEFEILALLVERKNTIVHQDTLCHAIWGNAGAKEAKRLAVIVSRLRELVADSYPYVIETVRSRGYGLRSVIQRGPMIKSIDPAGMHDWHSEPYVQEWIQSQNEVERDDLMRRLVHLIPYDPDEEIRVLDVGAGYGPLSKLMLDTFPNAKVVLHDYSEPMLDEARARLNHLSDSIAFVRGDLLTDEWIGGVKGTFHVVLSTNAIHNVRFPRRIKAIYQQIYSVIEPGGCFINMDRVPHSDRVATIDVHRRLMEERWQCYEQTGETKDLSELAATLRPSRVLATASPLPPSSVVAEEPATLMNQLRWLNEMGFNEVECFWRDKGRALIGAYRS